MLIKQFKELGFVEIWLTQEESRNADLCQTISSQIAQDFAGQKFRSVVYISGCDSARENIKALMLRQAESGTQSADG